MPKAGLTGEQTPGNWEQGNMMSRARRGADFFYCRIWASEQASHAVVLKLRQKVGKQKATPWLGRNLSRGERVGTQTQLLGVC